MKSHCKTAFLGVSLTALLACVATNKNIVANTVVDKSLPSLEDTYGVWKVFTVDQSDKKVCYVSSNPVETNGNHHNHRDPYLMVAFFEHGKQEVSISAGYRYKMKSVVAVSIDGQQHGLKKLARTNKLLRKCCKPTSSWCFPSPTWGHTLLMSTRWRTSKKHWRAPQRCAKITN